MRHKKHKNTLGLKEGHRKALLNNLAIAVIKNNRIVTTQKKAKAASSFTDKLITIAKKNDLHARRQLFAYLKSRELVKYLVDTIAPRFANRQGGYTRIVKYKNRVGDGALLALLELTEIPEVVAPIKKKKKKKETSTTGKESSPEKKNKAKDAEVEKSEAAAEEEVKGEEKKAGFLKNLKGYLKK